MCYLCFVSSASFRALVESPPLEIKRDTFYMTA